MRQVILFIATSLDGYIARPDGAIDWLFTDQDYGYPAFYAGVDTVLMGRRTYDQTMTLGEYPYGGKEVYVFSRGRGRSRDDRLAFVSEDPAAFVKRLVAKPGKNIWLVGGAELVQSFQHYGLIDEFIISIHPVILGSGIPLFRSPSPSSRLILVDCTTFLTGLVQLTYMKKS